MRPAKDPKTHCADRDQKSLPTSAVNHRSSSTLILLLLLRVAHQQARNTYKCNVAHTYLPVKLLFKDSSQNMMKIIDGYVDAYFIVVYEGHLMRQAFIVARKTSRDTFYCI